MPILSLVVTLCMGVGPILDPIEGSVLTPQDRDLLPSSRHIGAIADTWFANIVNLQNGGGGMEMFDAPYVGADGRSYTQVHFLLNGLDITDPAQPGVPLIQLPHYAWDQLHYKSLWTATPGFNWDFGVSDKQSSTAMATGGTAIDQGGTWVPKGFMDREPANSYGAPDARRKLRSAQDIALGTNIGDTQAGLRFYGESINHDHQYLTLNRDSAQRGTAMVAGSLTLFGRQVRALLAWQGTDRSNDGAQYRWPTQYTQALSQDAIVSQIALPIIHTGDLKLDFASGFSHGNSTRTADQSRPLVWDIENEWNTLARLQSPQDVRRWRIDTVTTASFKFPVKISYTANYSSVRTDTLITDNLSATTYERGPDYSLPTANTLTLYKDATRSQEWMSSHRLGGEWQETFSTIRFDAIAALDYGVIGDRSGATLSQFAPALGAAVRLPVGDHQFFFMIRREPEQLNRQAAQFLDSDTPSSQTYRWLDNGDGVPQQGEEGDLLYRSGGEFHRKAGHLRRPSSNHLAFGWRSAQFGRFRGSISGIARMLLDRYTVRYAGNMGYSAQGFHDPGGDGRGETRVPGGGQDLTVYNRNLSSAGSETYVLQNATRPDYFLGLELQLATVTDSWWFLNLSGTAYLSRGAAQFGSFPDRNDPGVIDESSADPNHRVNSWGRYDHDRSFGLNLLTGVTPLEGLTTALNIRYRDGQPLTRVVVDPNLTQGPTPIMGVAVGKPRATFHMTVDARIRYMRPIGQFYGAFLVDVFNILNSGTELTEDQRTGKMFRDPLEMIPGRTLLASLELGWRD